MRLLHGQQCEAADECRRMATKLRKLTECDEGRALRRSKIAQGRGEQNAGAEMIASPGTQVRFEGGWNTLGSPERDVATLHSANAGKLKSFRAAQHFRAG